jgi:hypothetical protein
MDVKEMVFGYLIDIEEDKAAELIRESDFKGFYYDTLSSLQNEFDEVDVYSYHIFIKAKDYKVIDAEYSKEKAMVEDALTLMCASQKQHVDNISWYPIPRINTEIAKYNQNDKMKQYLVDGDVDSFFKDVTSIFASFSYNMKITEAYFHSNIHTILKILGFNIVSEDETNLGRIDSVIEFDDKIYIIEFKTSDAKIAIDQIKNKKYYEKYLIADKQIFLVGVGCSLVERNITSWNTEVYYY